MEALEAMEARRSVRAYTDEKVTDEEIAKLLQAADTAPVGMNLKENMHITVVKDEELLGEFRNGADRDLTYGAPLLVIVSTKTDERFGAEIDGANASCVVENILIEATALGLGSVYLWGVTRGILPAHPEIQEKLNLPQGFKPFCAAAIGHSAEPVDPAKVGKRKKIEADII